MPASDAAAPVRLHMFCEEDQLPVAIGPSWDKRASPNSPIPKQGASKPRNPTFLHPQVNSRPLGVNPQPGTP